MEGIFQPDTSLLFLGFLGPISPSTTGRLRVPHWKTQPSSQPLQSGQVLPSHTPHSSCTPHLPARASGQILSLFNSGTVSANMASILCCRKHPEPEFFPQQPTASLSKDHRPLAISLVYFWDRQICSEQGPQAWGSFQRALGQPSTLLAPASNLASQRPRVFHKYQL